MRRILLYFSNILGILLILIFLAVIITENTDIVYKYYKESIKNEFKSKTDLNVNFDSLSIKWNGLNPSIIIQNLVLDTEEKKLLKSEQLIVKMGLNLPSKNIMFTVKELDLVGSNLSVQYNGSKILINDHDIFSSFNSESREYPVNKIKLRFSNSEINLYDSNSGKSYELRNLNAVIFDDSDTYNLYTTFNHGNDNQIYHLASRFNLDLNKKFSGSFYLKGVSLDHSYTDLIADNITLSLDNLKFTLWADVKNNKIIKSNGNVTFDNAYLSSSTDNQLHKINNGTFRFTYDYINKNRLFTFDEVSMIFDNLDYEDNEVSFEFSDDRLKNVKIKKIFVRTAKDIYKNFSLKSDKKMLFNDVLSDQGLLENVVLINLQSLLNVNYEFSYKNIGTKLSSGKYFIKGLNGIVIGDGNSGIFKISTSELSVSDDDKLLLALDSFSGSVGFKLRPNSIRIYSDDININDKQILNLRGKVASDYYNLRVVTKGDLELLKRQHFIQNNNLSENFIIESKYSLDYIFMKNKSKAKNYGMIELDDFSLRHRSSNLFVSADKYKAVFLDKLIFSKETKVTLNEDEFDVKIDSGISKGDLFYKIIASGLLSSDNIKSIVNTKLINSLDGEAASDISLKYIHSSKNPSLLGELRTNMVGFTLNIFSPLKKTKEEERKLFIKSDLLKNISYFDITYDVYDMRVSEKAEYMNINIVSPFLNGNVQIPNNVTDENKIFARLQYFDLNQFSGIADPREYLPMKLQIKKVKIYGNVFNNFNLQTSTHSDGMLIDKISFANEYLTMDGQGKWIDNTAGQMTFFDGNFNSTNFGKSLDSFGYKDLIKKGKLNSRLIGQWPNSPESFSFKNFDGKVLLDLKDGDFLQVTRETKVIGQLLGLFSITSLQKRLSLDFSDFFSSGLSFDQMTGEFVFLDSISNVKLLNLSGTFGEMTINGVSDLKKETHDHKLIYIPDLSSMSLISGTLLGGPIGAVASIFYDKVLKQIGIDTNELAAVEYSITGSWSDPKIILLEPFKQIEN